MEDVSVLLVLSEGFAPFHFDTESGTTEVEFPVRSNFLKELTSKALDALSLSLDWLEMVASDAISGVSSVASKVTPVFVNGFADNSEDSCSSPLWLLLLKLGLDISSCFVGLSGFSFAVVDTISSISGLSPSLELGSC